MHCTLRRLLFPLLLLGAAAASQANPRSSHSEPATLRQDHTLRTPDGASTQLAGVFNADTGMPVRVSGGVEETGLRPEASTADLLALIDRHRWLFRIPADELEVLRHETVRGRTYFSARQVVDDRPVLDSEVVLRIAGGSVALWGSDVSTQFDARWEAAIPASEAAARLLAHAGISSARFQRVDEVWVREGTALRPAWRVLLAGTGRPLHPEAIVDARNGRLLAYGDRFHHATIAGTVYGATYPLSSLDSLRAEPLGDAWVAPATAPDSGQATDSLGHYLLEGLVPGVHDLQFHLSSPPVAVQNAQLSLMGDPAQDLNPYVATATASAPDTLDFHWHPDSGSATIAASNVYLHARRIARWWSELDSSLALPDSTVYVFPDQTGQFLGDNAGFMPIMPGYSTVNAMMFGVGGNDHNNYGHFAEIIYHEYNHGITGELLGNQNGPPGGQISAMHEAFSDYFAGTITGRPEVGLGFIISDPDSAIRTMDNDLSYPEDYQNNSHHDGQILSGACWDLRSAIGAETADTLLHLARYGAPQNFEAYFQELLFVDDDNGDLSDGTPHEAELLAAFNAHGIGEEPSDVPRSTPGAGLPRTVSLAAPYPNPFNPTTRVTVGLPRASRLSLQVFDLLGRELVGRQLGRVAAGYHSYTVDGCGWASGTYLLRIQADGVHRQRKIVLLK